MTVTDEGLADPLFAGMPRDFAAYGGHKEALSELPGGAVLLATSAACPVQAFKVGENVYATQFHPELDRTGIHTRIDVYSTFGYFDPSEAANLKAASDLVDVTHPMTLLANFRDRDMHADQNVTKRAVYPLPLGYDAGRVANDRRWG